MSEKLWQKKTAFVASIQAYTSTLVKNLGEDLRVSSRWIYLPILGSVL